MLIFGASLKENLVKHKLWLDSHGDKGKRFSAAGINLEKTDLSRINLSKANLSGVNLSQADLRETNLSEATLFGAKLSGANLNEANLSGASLSGAEVQGATLQSAVLIEAMLCEADFTDADLSRANLYKANLSLGSPEFVKAKNIQSLSSGSSVPFVAVSQTNLKRANLSGANLSEANLDFANLYAANLRGANLSKAKLFAVNLSGANLSKANLIGADLFQSIALDADFSFANLTDACIEGWIIDRDTKFDDVVCDSIYLKHILRSLPDYILRKYSDRRPFNPKAIFSQGDFVKLVIKERAIATAEQKSIDALDKQIQEKILIEEMYEIFEYLTEQYLHRYIDLSEGDRQTLLKLEIQYHIKTDLAFKLRLVEAINTKSQNFIKILTDNNFVNISQATIQSWL